MPEIKAKKVQTTFSEVIELYEQSTVAAISTPYGTGGIAVIRVSGKDAFSVCDKVFKSPYGKKIIDAKSHTVLYGYIYDENTAVDEVLCTVMHENRSFTGENTVEISCHGGIFISRRVLSSVIAAGAHLAAPGEFTKRAFLNGRLDLSQANAVIDMINAGSAAAASLALSQLKGSISQKIDSLRDGITDMIAEIDAASDFPEEDLDTVDINELKIRMEKTLSEIDKLIKSADKGRLIRDGINTVIAGKPNVGKSSVLNMLSAENRAIVTDIAGTTRDAIEETVNIGNISLNIFDTAGIRETDDYIEAIGIEKTKEHIRQAELVLFIIDAERGIDKEDEEIARLIENKKTIAVINKTDIKNDCDISKLKNAFEVVSISAKTGAGAEELTEKIEKMFEIGEITKNDEPVITNVMHKESLLRAKEYVISALDAASGELPEDFVSIDLRNAASELGRITGRAVSGEVVDKIFSKFCLGK